MPNDNGIQSDTAGVGLGYGFTYAVLAEYYSKQERPGDQQGEGYVFAWAVLSYFCTAAVMSIESLLLLAELPTLGMLVVPESFPYAVLRGWSYPLFLFVNFRAFFGSSRYWNTVRQQYSAMPNKVRTYWKVGVGFSLVSLFLLSNYLIYLSV